MTETKPTNGLLTDRLNSTDRKTDNLANNRRIETHQWLMTNFTRVFESIPLWLNWPITFNGPTLEHHRLTNTIHLTLKMTSAQVVETLVTNNSSFQNYPHPDDHTIRLTTHTPGFKPFTTLQYYTNKNWLISVFRFLFLQLNWRERKFHQSRLSPALCTRSGLFLDNYCISRLLYLYSLWTFPPGRWW